MFRSKLHKEMITRLESTGLVLKVQSTEFLLEVCITAITVFIEHYCSASTFKITFLKTTVSGSLHLLSFLSV